METRARHVLIGLFTLAAAVLPILFALWPPTSQSERDFPTYDIAFAEAVRASHAAARLNTTVSVLAK